MNTIIVPTDFSHVSLNALNYASDMAVALQLKLLVLHATESNVLSSSPGDISGDDVEEKFMKLKTHLIKRTANKIKVHFKQVPGIIENELIKICERKHPFAIVMATHGANAKTQFFIESITIHLSRHLKYPVIVVPENVQYRQVQKIVLATDLKDVEKLPAEKVMATVKAFNARLHVLHINTNDGKLNNENSPEIAILKTRLQPVNPVFHFLKSKNVQKGILMFAESNKADIIITVPKKHILFHRSESKQVIFNSPVTVMSIQ